MWNSNDWSVYQEPLDGHKSSVVQLAFSPDDQRLISVSKDRQVCIFELQSDGKFQLQERLKAHKRIIWSCAWAPNSDLFATGSRDQCVGLWGQRNGQWGPLIKPLAFDSAVTAVSFAPRSTDVTSGRYLLAIGLGNGFIQLFSVRAASDGPIDCQLLIEIDAALVPSSSINRLVWSPSLDTFYLAVGSSDGSVRILHFHQ